MESERHILIIAGPDGAGKSTLAREYLVGLQTQSHIHIRRNDLPGRVTEGRQAGWLAAERKLLANIRDAIASGKSMLIETTLSSRVLLHHIPRWKAQGYAVSLVYLMLDNIDQAIARVASRVALGGGDVPEAQIRREYTRGLQNLPTCCARVDRFAIYNVAGRLPKLLTSSTADGNEG